MRKRRIYSGLLLLAVAGLIGVWMWGGVREREPEYGGKRLSEWVESYLSSVDVDNPRLDTRSEKAQAIRHIGTNALPYLLKCIRYDPGTLRPKLYRLVNPILVRMNPRWELTDFRSESRGNAAVWTLMLLGPEAEGTVAELTKVLNEGKTSASAGRAAAVLRWFGNTGLPPLFVVLTNQESAPWRRVLVVHEIEEMGSSARPVVPVLEQLLTDRDGQLRNAATNALRRISPEALERAGR